MSPAYPSLRIRFEIDGTRHDTTVILDTGFDGFLAVPEALTATQPSPIHRRRVRTADGQMHHVPVYLGRIELLDQPGPFDALIIAFGDEYPLGLAALNRFRVTFDHGQRVIVEP
jgi:predicted aspartyl protease